MVANKKASEIMENQEAFLDELNDFDKKRPSEISPTLDDFLTKIAKTGDTLFPWAKVKSLIHRKLEIVMNEFYETCPIETISTAPNVDTFKYESLRETILEAIESFESAPFTIQRICELITSPKKHYKRTDKFMRGLEKNILVVSTVEPSIHRGEVNNNGNMLVNGVLEAVSSLLGSPLSNVGPVSTTASISSLDRDVTANFEAHSIMNGLTDEVNASSSVSSVSVPSAPSSSSSLMITSVSMFASTLPTAASRPAESESSSSSDSDSSTDSLNTDYSKDLLLDSVADSTSVRNSSSTSGTTPGTSSDSRVSSHQPESHQMVLDEQDLYLSTSSDQPTGSDQPCSSHTQNLIPEASSEGNSKVLGSGLEPEEGVSSSDIPQGQLGTRENSENSNILTADSTDGNTSQRSPMSLRLSDLHNRILDFAESSVGEPDLSLGDELSVVKQVAQNLVETLLSQSDEENPFLEATESSVPFNNGSSSSRVDLSQEEMVGAEVTSLGLDVSDVAEHFATEMAVQGSEAQAALVEKSEFSDHMETDPIQNSDMLATSSTSSVPTEASPIASVSSPSQLAMPDQSEPMDED